MKTSGTLIVLNKAEASASLINLQTGKEFAKIATGVGPHEVAVSPDGKTAVVCNYGDRTPGNSLSVIDLKKQAVTKTIDLGENHRPHGIVYLSGGNSVVVTTEQSQKLLIVNLIEGKITTGIDTGAQISHMVAITPDEKRAFVSNIGSASVTVIDLGKRERLKEIKTGEGAEGLDISPDGKECWVSNRSGDSVSVIDTGTLEIDAELPCKSFPIRVKFTPDGKHALVSNASTGDVAVFDTRRRELIKRISMNETAAGDADQRLFSNQFGDSPVPVGILVDPSGEYAYIANTNADVVTVVDLKRLEIVNRLRGGKEPDGLAWSPLISVRK